MLGKDRGMQVRDKTRILVDVDGVLADLMGTVLSILRRDYGNLPLPTYSDITDFRIEDCVDDPEVVSAIFAVFSAPGLARHLPILAGAKEGVAELREVADVVFVTAPYYRNPTWVRDRYAWLSQHFDIEQDDVVFTDAKFLIDGDYLVDDRVSNLLAFEEVWGKGTGVLVDQPWNQKKSGNLKRVRSFDAVISAVKEN